jgi:hypothetical protein
MGSRALTIVGYAVQMGFQGDVKGQPGIWVIESQLC